MKLLEFIKFIIKSLDFNYENENYLNGYLDALRICDKDVTVEQFGNPVFIVLYNKLKEEGKI